MKILITTDWYVPIINGVVTSVLNLQRELMLRGHDVRVLTLSQTTRSFKSDGVIYIGSVGAGKLYPGARIKTAFFSSFVQDIVKWRPDVVHSQCEFSTLRLGWLGSGTGRSYITDIPRWRISGIPLSAPIYLHANGSLKAAATISIRNL